jgi:beta-N-acetylhexosaminidase
VRRSGGLSAAPTFHSMNGGHYILMGVPGTELDAKTAAIIREVQPAGFILFGRNIKAPRNCAS